MPRPNIAVMACPLCGELAAVRRKSNGKLYMFCGECGMVSPSLVRGQNLIEKMMRPVTSNDPVWIVAGQSWKHTREEELSRRVTATLPPDPPGSPDKKKRLLDEII